LSRRRGVGKAAAVKKALFAPGYNRLGSDAATRSNHAVFEGKKQIRLPDLAFCPF
jgi:hypothetical protein